MYEPLTSEQLEYARDNRIGIKTLQRWLKRGEVPMGYGSDNAPGFETYKIDGYRVSKHIFDLVVGSRAQDETIARLKRIHEQDIKAAEALHTTLRARVEELENSYMEAVVSSLREERDELRAQLDRRIEEGVQLFDDKEELSLDLKAADGTIEYLKKEMWSAVKESDELRAQLDATREDLNNVMVERNQIRRELDALKHENSCLKLDIKAMQFDLESLKPKPVVEVRLGGQTIKVTFEDGVKVKTEVIRD